MAGACQLSPRQVYRCPEHGEFEAFLHVGEDVPEFLWCPTVMEASQEKCFARSYWIPSPPNFIGGPTTGAKKE